MDILNIGPIEKPYIFKPFPCIKASKSEHFSSR